MHASLAIMALTMLVGTCTETFARPRPGESTRHLRLPTPTIFAPGIISGSQNDGTPTFSRNSSIALFERTLGNRTIIFETHWTGSTWSPPRVASFSGPWNDQHPAFAPDGSYVVYTSVRRRVETGTPLGGRNVAHLWRVDRTRVGWSTPYELPGAVNVSDRMFRPSVAANGDLYFMSAAEVGAAGPRWRLYRAAMTKGGYAMAEPLPFSDDKATDVDPFIAPNGSYLLFSSHGRDAQDDGHEHLYIVRRAGPGWGHVHALRYDGDRWGADDGEPVVSPDGADLLFSSARSAPVDRSSKRDAMLRDIERRQAWDNGNANVWRLPMQTLLRANGT